MSIEMLNEPEVSTALTVRARATIALGSDKARTELTALVAKSAGILEVKNQDGREQAHSAAMALLKARTTIEKTSKTARDDAVKFSKACIAEENALIAITQPEEKRLLALRDAWDAARAAEKAEAERIERERITRIHLRIADIRAVVGLANAAKLPECWDLLTRLVAFKVEGFEEFSDEATAVLAETTATVTSIHAAKVAEEAERQRIRAEQEAERLKLAAEREELNRLRAEQAAAQAKVEADAKAMRDAEAAELTRQRDAFLAEVAAANKAQQEARAALEAELSMMRAALAEPAETEPEPVVPTEPVLETVAYVDVVAGTPWAPDAEPEAASDEDIISTAIGAVADRFDVPWAVALVLLRRVDWSATTPELLEQAA